MQRRAIVAALLVFAGCREPAAPQPFLVGTITSRAARVYAIQLVQATHIDSSPQMMVEEEPGLLLSPATCDKIGVFSLTEVHSVRYASGLAADTSALTVGTKVQVWVTGLVAGSCPPQAAAHDILIEGSP